MEGDLPIALRRTPRCQQRRASLESLTPPRFTTRGLQRRSTNGLKTPTSRPKDLQSRGKVSGSVPAAPHKRNADDRTITVLDFDIPLRSISTPLGLKRKRQRHSTGSFGAPNKRYRQDDSGGKSYVGEDENEVVHIFPLRQILDGRIRRRIRRNGLSEEMNTILAEKRTRRRKTEEEIQRLRDDMAGKDAEIERLRGTESSMMILEPEGCDTTRLQELEKRVAQLKEELNNASSAHLESAQHDDSGIGMSEGLWDNDSDDGRMDIDDEDTFGNSTVQELQCSTTPGHPAKTWACNSSPLRNSGPTLISPPSTSPTRPLSPTAERRQESSLFCNSSTMTTTITTCDAALQVCIPGPEEVRMEEEANSLRSELASLHHSLQPLEAHMREKLSDDQRGCNDMDFDLQLDILLQDQAEKAARLTELQSLLSSLLSTPSRNSKEDINDQVTSLRRLAETLRSVRPALEELSPGETLPDGVDAVLDLALGRLRDLSREAREKDESLEEIEDSLKEMDNSLKEIGESLKKQDESIKEKDEILRERDAMIQHQDEIIKDGDRQIDERDSQIRDRDSRISALELDVQRLNSNITDLEALARRLGEGEALLRSQLSAERETSSHRDETLRETEAKLADVLEQAAALRAQLAERDMQLIHRDARLAGLRGEVERLGGALAEAHGQLRAARGDAARDRVRAQNAVVAMRAQLLQALSVGEGFLGLGGASDPSSSAAVEGVEAVPKEEPGLSGRQGAGAGEAAEAGYVKGSESGVVDLAALPAVPTGELNTSGTAWKV
ncbi:hypothetical protein VPNG_05060 [Cytospora leucostoma]|uniref:t-SNARE coiled-coil homology domain-containing protein n=1 Tax=Cytospora leucostoma TaxID=1230097 RepID=A0A423X459_9PEZI|nr:hypothetical protein VPNG_05060 [Cytospora leucostoma]